jgi:DNA-binding transcriptional MocR family regulator
LNTCIYNILVNIENDGIDVIALEQMWQSQLLPGKQTIDSPYQAVLFLVPHYHNPTGYVISEGIVCLWIL